jgi:putative DNA primase/helicase
MIVCRASTRGKGVLVATINIAASEREAQANDLPEEEFSDTGNAARLARVYGHKLKNVPLWGWLAYDGKAWRRDAEGEAQECAKACARDMLREAAETADRARREALTKNATRAFQERGIAAMVKLAATAPGIKAKAENFDSHPYLLNVSNGTIDLRTGTLREHQAEDLLTQLSPVEFDLDAEAPRWLQFLHEVFDGDEELKAYVRRAVGYSATGSTREHAMFIPYGTGRNGKSTMLDTLAHVLGDGAATLDPNALVKQTYLNSQAATTQLNPIIGARLVRAAEPERGRELNTALIKALTGGEPVNLRKMRQEVFPYTPQCKIWLSFNERPAVSERTVAIWERLKMIPFKVSFAANPDRELEDKLKDEDAGILNWVVAGAREWLDQGLGTCDAVTEATQEYKTDSDVLADFFETVLVPGDRVLATDAYNAFTVWQRQQSGVSTLTRQAFYEACRIQHGYQKVKGTGNKAYLLGCRLATPDATEQDTGGTSFYDDDANPF